MNNSEKVLSFTGEFSITVNLERREHADGRLLIITHADNNHLFDGKRRTKTRSRKWQNSLPRHLVFWRSDGEGLVNEWDL